MDEADKPIQAIEQLLDDVQRNKIELFISIIAYIEVKIDSENSKKMDEFDAHLKRSNVHVANVDQRISDIAIKIRRQSIQENEATKKTSQPLPKIKIPDSLIIATGLYFKASILYSFDPDMLKLNGCDIIDRLPIVQPGGHGQLLMNLPTDE